VPETTVENDPDRGRYVVKVDGEEAGSAHYVVRDGAVVFTHTVVDPDREGQGIGSRLAKGALEDVVTRGQRFVARCPFVAAYVERHPEYAEHAAG
jgi:predicted GNAT family acetyltransferase